MYEINQAVVRVYGEHWLYVLDVSLNAVLLTNSLSATLSSPSSHVMEHKLEVYDGNDA